MVGPKIKREVAQYAKDKFAVSATRICKILGLPRSTFDYSSHPRDNSHVKRALLELAEDNKRFGHPRLFTLLKRDKNIHVNHKRSEAVYQKLGLQIKNRKRKKLGGSSSRNVVQLVPYGEGDVLAIDFVFDYIESGRRLKVLTMVDEKTKVSPSLMMAHSIRGIDLDPLLNWHVKNCLE